MHVPAALLQLTSCPLAALNALAVVACAWPSILPDVTGVVPNDLAAGRVQLGSSSQVKHATAPPSLFWKNSNAAGIAKLSTPSLRQACSLLGKRTWVAVANWARVLLLCCSDVMVRWQPSWCDGCCKGCACAFKRQANGPGETLDNVESQSLI